MEINIEWRRGQYRILSGGAVRHYAADYGEIIGTKGADGDPIDVYRGLFSRAETVFVINQYHDNGTFDEHKIMLHFYDETHAKSAYELTCEKTVREIFACTPAQLDWWLQHGNHKKPVTANSFPFDSENPQMNSNHDWTNESQTAAELIYGWRKTDTYGELTQAATLDSVIFDELADGAEIQAAVFDALSVENKRLERTAQLLGNAFNRASGSLKVVENGIHISEPMRKNGTTNIAVMFEMTDGQTVSVLFHNPDTTPAKITPDDVLVSWKWLLNRKDITIVVAKEDGKDLPLPTVARRVMALVEKNTARFAKANANKAAETEELQRLQAEKDAKMARLAELNALAEQRANNNENNDPENSGSLNDENNQEIDDEFEKQYQQRKQNFLSLLQVSQDDMDKEMNIALNRFGEDDEIMERVKRNLPTFALKSKFDDLLKDKTLIQADDILVEWDKGKYKITDTHHSRLIAATSSKTGVFGGIPTKNRFNPQQIGNVYNVIPKAVADAFTELLEEYRAINQSELSGSLNDENPTIEVTGKEFGDFDASTEDGLKALRAAAKKFMMSLRGKWVHNTYLKRDIEIRKRGIRETFNYSANPIKLKLLAQIEQILATAKPVDGVQVEQPNYKKDVKPNAIRYFHLGNQAVVDGVSVKFDVIIEEDTQGVLHYDLVLEGSRKKAVMDSTDPSSITNTGTSLYPQQPETHSTELNDETQDDDFIEQDGLFDDAVFDDIHSSGGMVLNLFVFDVDGKPLPDDEDNIENKPMVNTIVNHYLKVGKTISNLGKIQDIYGRQFKIDGSWYDRVVVYEAIMPSLSFDKFRQITVSDDFDLVKAAYQYILSVREWGYKERIERFGIHAKDKKQTMTDLEWLQANLTIQYSKLLEAIQTENPLPDEDEQVGKDGLEKKSNPAKQQAIDFLNDIINGKIDGMADGVLDHLFELVEPFEDDDEINELAEKASAIIENAMPKNIE